MKRRLTLSISLLLASAHLRPARAQAPEEIDAPVAATPPPVAVAAYHYGGVSKRDPFRPFAFAVPSLQTLSQLQEADLKDLRLVGTLLGAEMSALIMTPKGEGIIAKVGDKIGRTGRIVAIIKDKIIVRQSVGEGISKQKFEDTIITLQRRNIETNNGRTKPLAPSRDGTFITRPGTAGALSQNSTNAINTGGISAYIPPPVNSTSSTPAYPSGTAAPQTTTPPPAPVAPAAATPGQ